MQGQSECAEKGVCQPYREDHFTVAACCGAIKCAINKNKMTAKNNWEKLANWT